MKKRYIIICVVIIMLLSGCRENIEINLNDYSPVEDYDFERDEFLMRRGTEEIDILGGIYSLKGLSPYEYVGHVQHYLVSGAPSNTLYVHNNMDEPIMRLDPYEIVLRGNSQSLTFKEKSIVEQLVDVRRKSGIPATYSDLYGHGETSFSMTFLFDVSCELEWHCSMLIEEQNIKMLWYDNETKEDMVCDVTDILKQHSVLEDVYSIVP